ncbi:RDD family protein [Peribacillus sp. JNUCC 23]|uniref:RDD family protein n=1 Tax=Peribacillus sp. NPDC096379 TaxID=3364393 RepID=UPI00380574D1
MVENPAGFWVRFGAKVIDALIFIVLGLILGAIFSDGTSEWVSNIISFLYALLLPIFWYGYTVGKKALKVRIVKLDGSQVTLWTMIKRNVIAWIVYGLPSILGVIGFIVTVGISGFDVLINEDLMSDEVLGGLLLKGFVWVMIGLLLSGVLYIISAFMIGLREDKRALHDLIAGTFVTKNLP